MRRTDGGFTLVEMMVTLVIASILLMLAVPSFRDLIMVSRLSTAANDLVMALMRARAEAIKLGSNVVVCGSSSPNSATPSCDGAWQSGWIVFVDDGATENAYDADEQILLVHGELRDTYTLTGTNNVSNRVTYRPQGVVAGNFGSFRLIDTEYSESMRLICITSTGKSRVVSQDVDPNATCS